MVLLQESHSSGTEHKWRFRLKDYHALQRSLKVRNIWDTP